MSEAFVIVKFQQCILSIYLKEIGNNICNGMNRTEPRKIDTTKKILNSKSKTIINNDR